MDYSFLPFQDRLALVELIDNAYCNYENKSSPEISHAVLQQTIDMMQQAGIKVILTSITGDDASNKVLDQFKAKGYHTLAYGINTGNSEYNLMPADAHPNYYANRIFAAKLYEEIGDSR
ncbi:MAG: hypothetical protein JST90_02790 [Bacteroidetes bacterium]|nr:hypothetical protein [Bacteroidota bacterium]